MSVLFIISTTDTVFPVSPNEDWSAGLTTYALKLSGGGVKDIKLGPGPTSVTVVTTKLVSASITDSVLLRKLGTKTLVLSGVIARSTGLDPTPTVAATVSVVVSITDTVLPVSLLFPTL